MTKNERGARREGKVSLSHRQHELWGKFRGDNAEESVKVKERVRRF